MTDDPNQGEGGGGTIRVRNIRADRQFSREVQVERLTVNTGEERDASSDLLVEVWNAIDEQTKTLSQALQEIENISQMQLNVLRRQAMAEGRMPTNRAFMKSIRESIRGGIQEAFQSMTFPGPPAGGGGGGRTQTPAERSSDDGTSGEFQKSLLNAIKSLEDTFQSLAVREQVPGGEEGGGGIPGRGFGEVHVLHDLYQRVGDVSDRFLAGSKSFKELQEHLAKTNNQFEKLIGSGLASQVEANVRDIAQQIQNLGTSLAELRKITGFFTERFENSLEIATSGVASFGDVMIDFIPELIRGGDNLVDTFRLVRSTMESEMISPLGTLGMDLDAVSRSLLETRRGFSAEGLNAVERLTWTEANEAMVSLFALERRRDVQASLEQITTRRNIAAQLEFAQMIATNTGRTAAEVVKINERAARQLRNLESGGILRGQERRSFERATQIFANTPGMEPFSELISGIARTGGSVELYLSQNPELVQDLAAMGQIGQLRNLIETVRGGGVLDDDQLGNALMQAAQGFNVNRFTGIAGAATISERGLELAGAAGLARQFRQDEDVDILTRNIRYLGDVLSNTIPSAEAAMVAALIANTAALGMNTVALGGLGLGRGAFGAIGSAGRYLGKTALSPFSAIGRGIGTAGGAVGRAGMGALTGIGGAMAGAGGVAAKGLGKLGIKSLLKKLPFGLGLLAATGFAGSRALAGDFTGAGLELASGAASIVPGLGTAGSVGIDAALAARDMGAFGSETPTVSPVKPESTTTNQGIRTDTQRLLMANNKLLTRILDELTQQTSLEEDIKRNTQRVSVDFPSLGEFMFGRGDDVEQTG